MEHVGFHGLRLWTEPGRVMTPRATTEQLVAAAVERLGGCRARVADVGTGSGALAVAIAVGAPQAEVWATDTSRCAVALARLNVRRHGLGGRVHVLHADLLEGVPRPVDLIVANLPYLPTTAAPRYPELADEPHDAVFAEGDGLDGYRRLVAASSAWLSSTGALAIQLPRRIAVAPRDELDELRAALDAELVLPDRAPLPRLAAA